MDYENEKDAEDALKGLNGKQLAGRSIHVAWGKRSDRYDPDNDGRPPEK